MAFFVHILSLFLLHLLLFYHFLHSFSLLSSAVTFAAFLHGILILIRFFSLCPSLTHFSFLHLRLSLFLCFSYSVHVFFFLFPRNFHLKKILFDVDGKKVQRHLDDRLLLIDEMWGRELKEWKAKRSYDSRWWLYDLSNQAKRIIINISCAVFMDNKSTFIWLQVKWKLHPIKH